MRDAARLAGAIEERAPFFRPGIPVVLTATYWLPRPASHFRKDGQLRKTAPALPGVKPDLANLTKGLEDALDGLAYRGDSQVVDHVTRKRWADGRPIGASVRLDRAFPEPG